MADLFNTAAPDTNKRITNIPEMTVSELSANVKRTIEDAFGYVRVRGEISKVTLAKSGHLYTTIKDENACLEAVAWKITVGRLSIKPEEGMEVVATGRLTTYPGRSNYQLIIETLELAGQGAILKMLADRKKKLEGEGLFDPAMKKQLPFCPRVIGVVTSPTGAVIRDILHRLADRFPVHVLVWPVVVQGANAAAEIVRGIEGFNNMDTPPDLLIVARGGGSIEDLMPFNEEAVVRAAAESVIPLISAVGHETDVTLIDFAADVRAPTPTAAAEMAVPVRDDMLAAVMDWGHRLFQCTLKLLKDTQRDIDHAGRVLSSADRVLEAPMQALDRAALQLDHAVEKILGNAERKLARINLRTPADIVNAMELRLNNAIAQLDRGMDRFFSNTERTLARIVLRTPADALKAMELQFRHTATRLKLDISPREKNVENLARVLETLSFKKTLERGFAVVRDETGKLISKKAMAVAGQTVTITLMDGGIEAEVK